MKLNSIFAVTNFKVQYLHPAHQQFRYDPYKCQSSEKGQNMHQVTIALFTN